MKRLYLLRHSKADNTKDFADEERPLSRTGIDRCRYIADAMAQRNYLPDACITSNALRAKDTAERVAKLLPKDVPVEENAKLYLATPGEILTQIEAVDDTISQLVITGHNPGLHQLAILLTHQAPPQLLKEMTLDFPPGVLVAYDLEIDSWGEIEAGVGILVDYLNPKHH
jgi:phosphohistidine phosphatase